MNFKSQSGFTLIELMIVILIIGTLSMISVPVYNGLQEQAKVSADLANVNSLITATTLWELTTGWTTADYLAVDYDTRMLMENLIEDKWIKKEPIDPWNKNRSYIDSFLDNEWKPLKKP